MKIAEAMRMFFSGWSWFVKPLWSKVGGRMWKAIAFLESCNVWDGLETIPTSKHMFFFRWRFPSCKQPNGDRFPFFAIHPLVTWGVLRNFRLIIRSVSWQIIKSHCVKLVSQYPNLDFLWVAKQIRNMKKPSKKPSKKPTIAEQKLQDFLRSNDDSNHRFQDALSALWLFIFCWTCRCPSWRCSSMPPPS